MNMDNKIDKVDKLNQYEFGSNTGQINIANDNSSINAEQYFDNRSLSGIDIIKLKEELLMLESKLAEKKLYIEASSVKNAIEAKEEHKISEFLKSAGQKSLDVAKDVCLIVAAKAIKKSIGV